MSMHLRHTKHHTYQTGTTMAEYAMLIGLVGVVSIIGLKALGGSTHQLIAGTGTGLKTNNTMSVLKPISTSNSTAPKLKGTGYYAFVTDSVTGRMTLKMVDGNQGIATNVTSVDGNRNTLGTLMIANKLQQLADAETDPELQAYYSKMAKLSYYLGGAEGELDDVPDLDLDPGVYNNGQALKDVVMSSQELQLLLQNPPANLQNTAEYAEVMPLAVEVYNIAQNYKNSLSEFISADGTVVSFGSSQANTSGNGSPGSALASNDLIVGNPAIGASFDDLISYNDMRSRASKVLSDNKVESAPVESTLTDATEVYEQAVTP
jgi:Flp pilus assembly pilin Flp